MFYNENVSFEDRIKRLLQYSQASLGYYMSLWYGGHVGGHGDWIGQKSQQAMIVQLIDKLFSFWNWRHVLVYFTWDKYRYPVLEFIHTSIQNLKSQYVHEM